jgi:hypothetical protein
LFGLSPLLLRMHGMLLIYIFSAIYSITRNSRKAFTFCSILLS